MKIRKYLLLGANFFYFWGPKVLMLCGSSPFKSSKMINYDPIDVEELLSFKLVRNWLQKCAKSNADPNMLVWSCQSIQNPCQS